MAKFAKIGNLYVNADRIQTVGIEPNGSVFVDIGGGPFPVATADGKALVEMAELNLVCKPAVPAIELPEEEPKAEKKAKK